MPLGVPVGFFRRTKAGVKLHTLLDHDGYLPAFVAISPARQHEVKKARSLALPKGSIIVADLGYTDYAWYADLIRQQVFFVTRQKRNAVYEVMESQKVNQKQGLFLTKASISTARRPRNARCRFVESSTKIPKPANGLYF